MTRWQMIVAMKNRAGHVLYVAEQCAQRADRNGERRYAVLARKMVRVADRWASIEWMRLNCRGEA